MSEFQLAALQILTATAPLLLGLVGVGAVRARQAMRDLYPAALAAAPSNLSVPRHDARRLTAVVLLDHAGAEVSDLLLPDELLAASGAFNVYAAALDARPAVLTGGLDRADLRRLPRRPRRARAYLRHPDRAVAAKRLEHRSNAS